MPFEDIIRLAQQRGFFFKSAESYPNSPAGFWDYGPLGVSMRNRLLGLWRRMIVERDRMVEIDGAQILPKAVFEASGHLSGFTDPFVQCPKCGSVYRPDKLIEEKTKKQVPEKLSDTEYDALLESSGVRCQKCGSNLSGTRRFNMMFGVGVGAQREEAYLRPETCQSIFVDFPLLFKTQRVKLPVGFAQVGKSFRNEIAPRQGLIRLRELVQAEVEVFFNPKKTDSPGFADIQEAALRFILPDGNERTTTAREAVESGVVPNPMIAHYLALIWEFYVAAGIPAETIRFRKLSDKDKAFYSVVAYDLEVQLSVGWLELVACNYRGDHDLSSHMKVSGTDFRVDDEGEKVLPHIFELSLGVDRSIYAIMESSFRSEGDRKLMALKPYLAPVQAGVFPLINRDGLPELAEKVLAKLSDEVVAFYDGSGSIGRRYARADEAGVPYCVTVDHDSLTAGTVTVRERDTTKQERVHVDELPEKLRRLVRYPALAR